MLKPAKMQKIRIVASKSIARPLLAEIHSLGALELRRFESEGFESGKPMEVHDRISSAIVHLRYIKSMLGLSGKGPTEGAEMELESALREAESLGIEEHARENHFALEECLDSISGIESRLRDISKLEPLNIDFSKTESKILKSAIGTIPAAKQHSLKIALAGAKMGLAESGEECAIAVAYSAEDEQVEAELGRHGFVPIDTRGFTTPAETKAMLASQLSAAKKKKALLEEEIAATAKKHGEKLLGLEHALSLWEERAFITKEMGIGAQAIIIEGWAKSSELGKIADSLVSRFGDKVYVEPIPSQGEDPPVVLEHPSSTYPSQFLVRLFSLPKSSEIDPTLILFITVPLLYGMILGDAIYGAISFVLASWLMAKWKKGGFGYGVASIWRFSAISGAIFGVMYDEWLGMPSYSLLQLLQAWGLLNLASLGIYGPLYHGFHRSTEVTLLLGLSILLGLLHLSFGFLLGAINCWHHNKKHAIGKLSWIFMIAGGFLAVGASMFGIFPEEVGTAGLGLFIIATAAMVATEGPMGLFEIPGVLGNVLSYTRIAAVGMVGVLLAELINKSFIPAPEQGIVYAFIMLPILSVLHTMNIFLAMAESLLQGGRLNMVEFYSKFFQGGGKEFKPFTINVKR